MKFYGNFTSDENICPQKDKQAAPSIKKNTLYNMLKTFSSIVFPLITFPYVSRVLSPSGIGQYNFSSTYVGYFSLIASLGITTYAIRECSKVRNDKERLNCVASQIFSINMIMTTVAYAALFISLVFFRKLDSYRTIIIISSSSILFTTIGADWINSAFEDFKYITIRTFVIQLASLLLIVAFVRQPGDAWKYACITAVASGGANIMNIQYRKRFCDIRFMRKLEWKKHFPPIAVMFVMILAQQIFTSADVTMLGLMKGDWEVGLYSTAQKVTNLINQVLASIVWVILPRTSNYFANREYDKLTPLLKKILEYMLGLGIPIVCGAGLLSNRIIYIVGGLDYADAALTLRILLISLFVGFFGGSFLGNVITLSSGKEMDFMKACIFAAVFNVIFNAILIPKYGQYGAAFTTVCSSLIILIYLAIKIDKNIKLPKLKTIVIAPAVGSIVMCICVGMLIPLHLSMYLGSIFMILVGVVSYGIVIYVMKYDLAVEIIEDLKRRI